MKQVRPENIEPGKFYVIIGHRDKLRLREKLLKNKIHSVLCAEDEMDKLTEFMIQNPAPHDIFYALSGLTEKTITAHDGEKRNIKIFLAIMPECNRTKMIDYLMLTDKCEIYEMVVA
jgi:hypothetical protein